MAPVMLGLTAFPLAAIGIAAFLVVSAGPQMMAVAGAILLLSCCILVAATVVAVKLSRHEEWLWAQQDSLRGLAGKTDAELIVLHATDHTLNKDYDKKVFETFKIELQTKIKYKELKVLILENKNIVEGIDQFCTETKADLLVTSPEKPPLLERIFMPNYPFTNKMSLHTKMPLLTIPDYYSPDYRAFWKIFEMDEQILEDLL
jgi:hypothetical protein